MKSTTTDPIVAEVRAVRDEYTARFGYDVAEMFRDLRARQEKSGREYAGFPARRASSEAEDISAA